MSITQKECPEVTGEHENPNTGEVVTLTCGKPAVKIDRDRYGKRTCEDGHEWYPSKRKAGDE